MLRVAIFGAPEMMKGYECEQGTVPPCLEGSGEVSDYTTEKLNVSNGNHWHSTDPCFRNYCAIFIFVSRISWFMLFRFGLEYRIVYSWIVASELKYSIWTEVQTNILYKKRENCQNYHYDEYVAWNYPKMESTKSLPVFISRICYTWTMILPILYHHKTRIV